MNLKISGVLDSLSDISGAIKEVYSIDIGSINIPGVSTDGIKLFYCLSVYDQQKLFHDLMEIFSPFIDLLSFLLMALNIYIKKVPSVAFFPFPEIGSINLPDASVLNDKINAQTNQMTAAVSDTNHCEAVIQQ